MTLAILFVLAELADLATYLQAPHLESNPAMQGWPPVIVAAKFLGVTAIAALALIGLTGRKQQFALGACLAVAAFSFGTNAHALSVVAAAEAPRPATQPAPIAQAASGIEQGTSVPAAASRTPAFLPGRRQPAVASPRDVARGVKGTASGPATIRGTASWYPAAASVAAAGPALRRALGPGWRGTWVRVSSGSRSIVVRLGDWCGCPGGRVIDLSDDDFAVLAPLGRGLVRVSISRLAPPATDR